MKTKIVQKAYKFRIYPTLEQIIFFSKTFGCVRKVYNLMLDDRKKDYEEYKLTGIKTKNPTPAKYKETLKLSERIYKCECCGLEIDRDYNASINILRKGLEILKVS